MMTYEPKPIDTSHIQVSEDVENLIVRLNQDEQIGIPELLGIWRARIPSEWSLEPEVYRQVSDRFLKHGQSFLAFDVATEGLSRHKKDIRLRQLKALALSRTGAMREANRIMFKLREEGQAGEETLGMLGSNYKKLEERATDSRSKAVYSGQAVKYYRMAYERTGGYWSGINAATLLAMSGNMEEAKVLAGSIYRQCQHAAASEDPRQKYWRLATLGEAAVILGDWKCAEDWYCQAAQQAGPNYGDISTTRRQALKLAKTLDGPRHDIAAWLPLPNVVVFVGHMIDMPNRYPERFPRRLENAVRMSIRTWLEQRTPLVAFSAAAQGSDIIFLEEVEKLRGETHVVLPFEEDEFCRESVNCSAESGWTNRFREVLRYARQTGRVTVVSSQKLTHGSLSYVYANDVMHGLAQLHADQLDVSLTPLAVWDGKPGDGVGGTSTTIRSWQEVGLDVDYVDLDELLNNPGADNSSDVKTLSASAQAPRLIPKMDGTQLVAILFADVKGFAALTDRQIPAFVEHCMGTVAELIKRTSHKPVVKNTWGDALYCVFENVTDAGLFAIQLQNRFRRMEWDKYDLPPSLKIRIGLHAGPAYECVDRVTGQPNFVGAHVSRGARIEPITPPGHVYASQPFAALVRRDNISDFICEYVGDTPLAKGYGTFPTYHVRRTRQRHG